MRARVASVVICLTSLHAPGNAFARFHQAGCDNLSWPLDAERAWFSDKNLSHRSSGARLRRVDRAVDLSLRPSDQVNLFLPPDGAPRRRGFSGQVTFFGVPRPGIYQVTLSAPATVDVFENGARLKAIGQMSIGDCPGVSESARYDLAPGDLVLVQITDASTRSIKVGFNAAEPGVAWSPER